MRNYDEWILRSRQLDPQAPYPLLHQAVRIALFEEYAARSFYTRVVESFGTRAPFARLLDTEARHIEALSQVCARLGIARPLDPFAAETGIEPTWLANCHRGMAGEVGKVHLYSQLLAVVADPEVQRVFLSVQTSAYEQHIPDFRAAILAALDQEQYHAAIGVPPQQAYAQHGPLSDFIERTLVQMSGQSGLLGLLSPLVRNSHPAMLTGLAVGGAGVYWLKKRSGANRKEN